MIRAAIFDLDGTILDSMPIWETIAEDYLISLGKKPHEDLKQKFKSLSLEQAAEYYISNYQVSKTVNEIIDDINGIIRGYYFNTAQLKDNVFEFLSELEKSNIKMCIATATDRELAEAALKRTGIDRYISFIITCGEVGLSKSQPAIFKKALRGLCTSTEETAVFEDAPHAALTAKSAGFTVIGVYDKSWSAEDTQKLKGISDYYIETFTQIHCKKGELII